MYHWKIKITNESFLLVCLKWDSRYFVFLFLSLFVWGLFYFIWGLEGCLLFLLLLRTCDSGQGLLVVAVGGSALSSPSSAPGFSELSWATMSRNTCSLCKLRVFLGKCCYTSFSEMGSRIRWIKRFYPDPISVLEQSCVSLTTRVFSSEP